MFLFPQDHLLFEAFKKELHLLVVGIGFVVKASDLRVDSGGELFEGDIRVGVLAVSRKEVAGKSDVIVALDCRIAQIFAVDDFF